MTEPNDLSDDVRTLHRMGYAQEPARVLGGFSNFAISLSIICILAGGITSFPIGFCSAAVCATTAANARKWRPALQLGP